MSAELATLKVEAPPAPVAEVDPMISMIERAARDPNVDIDKMERLFKMQQDAMIRRARTEYLAALAQLQAKLPAAVRGGTGHNQKKYARYEDIIEVLRPCFSEFGFSISHKVDTAGNQVKVTGILGHAGGHSEETVITLSPDVSGNKTPVHAVASAISYGKRYVVLTLTGIATEGEDDDAKAATAPAPISEEQAMQLRDLIAATETDEKAFCKYLGCERLSALPAKDFGKAMAALKKKAAKS